MAMCIISVFDAVYLNLSLLSQIIRRPILFLPFTHLTPVSGATHTISRFFPFAFGIETPKMKALVKDERALVKCSA